MTFDIRPATPADAPAIAEVHRKSSVATYTRWIPDFAAGFDVEERAAMWSRSATAEAGHLMLAEAGGTTGGTTGGTVLGFAASGPARGVEGAGEVYAIYVDPDRHDHGIGTALMTDALGWLAGRGCPECVVWVAEPSTRTRAFYEARGFTLDTADDASEPWHTITAVRYRRPLP